MSVSRWILAPFPQGPRQQRPINQQRNGTFGDGADQVVNLASAKSQHRRDRAADRARGTIGAGYYKVVLAGDTSANPAAGTG